MFRLQRKWPDLNHSPSTSGELLSRVTECFYSGGDLTVNELMKQIDDYMDYYNWGAMQFENKKLGPAYIQNPAYAERLNRLLWVPKVEASSTRLQMFRRPLLSLSISVQQAINTTLRALRGWKCRCFSPACRRRASFCGFRGRCLKFCSRRTVRLRADGCSSSPRHDRFPVRWRRAGSG